MTVEADIINFASQLSLILILSMPRPCIFCLTESHLTVLVPFL